MIFVPFFVMLGSSSLMFSGVATAYLKNADSSSSVSG